MIDSVGNGSSVYSAALLKVGGSIRDRLIKRLASEEPSEPVVKRIPLIKKEYLAETPRPTTQAQLNEKVKGAEYGGDIVAALMYDSKGSEVQAIPVEEGINPLAEKFVLKPGVEIKGQWGAGTIDLPGAQGRYFVEPGYSTIKFEMGGFTGHLISPTKALAYNPETQQTLTFDVSVANGEFKISNVQDLNSAAPAIDPAKAPDFPGKLEAGGVVFPNNMRMEFGENGRVKFFLGDPDAKDAGVPRRGRVHR